MIAGALCPQCAYHRVGPIEDKDGAIGPVTVLCACPHRSQCSTCPDNRMGRMSRLEVGGFVHSFAWICALVCVCLIASGVIVLRAHIEN